MGSNIGIRLYLSVVGSGRPEAWKAEAKRFGKIVIM